MLQNIQRPLWKMCECVMESDGAELYVTFDGVRIAKRGHPDTAQAGTWVSIEPGYAVYDNADLTGLVVELNGVRLQ